MKKLRNMHSFWNNQKVISDYGSGNRVVTLIILVTLRLCAYELNKKHKQQTVVFYKICLYALFDQ